MSIRIANVVFDAPGATLDLFGRAAGTVATMYADLLGMRRCSRADYYREAGYPADEGDEVDPLVLSDDAARPSIAFECERGDYRPPRWPDPSHPQQVHLDVAVDDLDAAHRLVIRSGARVLREEAGHRTYADAIGHPFCLYRDAPSEAGRIARVVFDCAEPAVMAGFYRRLLDMRVTVIDTPDFVEIGAEGRRPRLGFQRVADHQPPRWPDPAHPPQLHLDLGADDEATAQALAVDLGAARLDYFGGGLVFADPAGHPFCLGE